MKIRFLQLRSSRVWWSTGRKSVNSFHAVTMGSYGWMCQMVMWYWNNVAIKHVEHGLISSLLLASSDGLTWLWHYSCSVEVVANKSRSTTLDHFNSWRGNQTVEAYSNIYRKSTCYVTSWFNKLMGLVKISLKKSSHEIGYIGCVFKPWEVACDSYSEILDCWMIEP